MALDRDAEARAWLALSCARDGRVLEILRDDLGAAHAASPGARLSELVDRGSARKAESLVEALNQRGCIAGWELNVPAAGGARPLYFAGAAAEESLLILAAPTPASAAALFEAVRESAAETADALRLLLREQQGITAAMSRDNHLYEELSRLNNELINRERELARKSAALERVSAEKSRLMAIAAHDLRNPLTIVASYADLLKMDGSLDDERLSYVDEISRSARFMIELVEEMLDSARLESGYVELELEEIDLVQAVLHAATVNRLRAERKAIVLSFEGNADRAMIRADSLKLRQIINNLVVNAIKFSPSRTRVTVRVRRDPDRAILEVIDEGIGIPREKLQTIFEPFRTVGTAGTAGEQSTGLGLTIVKQLADLHGATVEVESEEGRGSTFRVAFPSVE